MNIIKLKEFRKRIRVGCIVYNYDGKGFVKCRVLRVYGCGILMVMIENMEMMVFMSRIFPIGYNRVDKKDIVKIIRKYK